MVDFAVYSHPGSREINEDYVSFFSDEDRFCFVIADGLGGEGSGDMASRFVCNHTISLAEKAEKLDSAFLEQCFTIIQKNLMIAKKELFIETGMTSTLSIVAFDHNTACWGHIGDTRIYCFSKDEMKSVTTDHSLAQFMIASGMSDLSDLRQHPDRSVLMVAMGMENLSDAYVIDEKGVAMKEPLYFLMCTDGFWQYVHEEEMMMTVAEAESAEAAIQDLVKIAKKNAGEEDRDNLSAIFIKYTPDE